jgi:hypothetical protein
MGIELELKLITNKFKFSPKKLVLIRFLKRYQ